jgi:hypothetical protein
MGTLIEALAGIAILANAVVYGTDVFGAIVLRPAGGLIAAVAMTAVAAADGRWVSAVAGALAALALVIFIAVYNRVSKPVNTALTAAALADRVPGDVRRLQARWDSVIDARVTLQAFAIAALCVALAAA